MTRLVDGEAADSPRGRIFAAADRLFRERGVGATNVEDIAEAAGMSRATLYRHVTGGRDEIVRTVIADNTESLMRLQVAVAMDEADEFEERLVRLLTVLDAAVRADEARSAMFHLPSMGAMVTVEGWTETAIDLVLRVLEPVLADARARGEVADALPDRLVAEWIMRQFSSLELMRSALVDDPAGFDTYVRTLVIAPLLARPVVPT